ncbi:MAG TPA: hypothetical protein VLF66_09700 [Thermoanaerobaculia bacterium]|nr:hypothetical protein [Thermoanaerobaculia bacterium]
MDELFWFWPRRLGDGARDRSLAALARGQVEAATAMWIGQEGSVSDGHVAAHNLAVLAHASALDLDHAGRAGSLSEDERALRDTLWPQALGRWEALLHRDGFWDRLAERVRSLDDPRLRTGTVEALRRSLPLALLLINARLAAQRAEAGDLAEVARQVRLIRESRFGERWVEEALHLATAGLRDRLRLLCKAAEDEAGTRPERAHEMARRLLDQTRPLLAALDLLLREEDEVRRGAHDQVALRVLSCQIAYGNRTDDWETSLALLNEAGGIAVGATASGRLGENVRIVQDNLEHDREYGTCFFCGDAPPAAEVAVEVKLHGEVVRVPVPGGVQIRWRSLTAKVPRCPACKEAQVRLAASTGVGGVLGGLAGVGGCFATMESDTGWLSVVLAIVLLSVGLGLGRFVGRRGAKTGIRGEGEASQFPPVRRLLAEGWSVGEKPADAN